MNTNVTVQIASTCKIQNLCVLLSVGHYQEYDCGNQPDCIKSDCRLSDGLRLFSEGSG